MTSKQKSEVASIYKTTDLHPDSQPGHNIRVDIVRAVISTDYIKYITMGGMLGHSYDRIRVRKLFPRGI